MDAHTVPFSKYPSYLPEGVLGMCTEGNAEIQIGLRKYVICANDILIFMPGFLVSFIKSSLTFTIDYCTFQMPFLWRDQWKYQTFSDRFSYLHPNPLHLFAIPRESGTVLPLFPVTIQQSYFSNLFIYKESITNLLKLPFLELYADYYSTVKEHKVTTLHKEEIGYFFWICC